MKIQLQFEVVWENKFLINWYSIIINFEINETEFSIKIIIVPPLFFNMIQLSMI